MNNVINFLIYRILKVSGLLYIIALIFTALATGQAEISYKFWLIGSGVYLGMLIVARIEGHHINK